MRLLVQAAALALLVFPVSAQTPAPVAPAVTRPQAPRVPLPERFAEANTAKDGHLTKSEARASTWYYVNRNFDAMDTDRKGFVRVEDIRGFARLMREQRAAGQQPAAAPNKS